MADRISDERIDTLASALRGAVSDVYAVVAAIKSERARADKEEAGADRLLTMWTDTQADLHKARVWAKWLAAERDYYRAELAQVKQIRHGDPEMFTATLMYELAQEEVTERVRRTVRALWASRRRWQETLYATTALSDRRWADAAKAQADVAPFTVVGMESVRAGLHDVTAERDALKARLDAAKHLITQFTCSTMCATFIDGPDESCTCWKTIVRRALDGEAVNRD